jgi:uncharacterized membrane protein (DUF2068 family)
MKEQRPRAVTVATILCVLNSLDNLGTLAAGPIPRSIVYASVVAAVLGLAGAYGLWQLKRWGALLSVLILVVTFVLAAPGVLFAPSLGLHALAAGTVIVDLFTISLLVVPSSRRAYA